jgi:multimeric flavodoxin WrbA
MSEHLTFLGISASPRKGGNSEYLLDKALESAGAFDRADVQTERVSLAGTRMSPCLGCYGCINAKGECVISDAFQPLRDAWLRADAVLYVIPVFAMSIPGQLKCFFDRLANSLIFSETSSTQKLKVAGTVAQGMHFSAGQETSIREIANISMLLGCLPVAGDSYNGVRGWTYQKLSRNTYRKAEEEGDAETARLVEEIRGLTRSLLIVATILRSGVRTNEGWLTGEPAFASAVRTLVEHQ